MWHVWGKTCIQGFDGETRSKKAVFTDLPLDGRQYQNGSQRNSLVGRELDKSGSE
jgi:hypothetical protein